MVEDRGKSLDAATTGSVVVAKFWRELYKSDSK